jgi:hypothetical protein
MIMEGTDDMNFKAVFFNAFAARSQPQVDQILRPNVSNHEANRLRALLASKTSTELTDYELRTVVEGNLWMLAPEAFLYFLPAFMHAALSSYSSVSVFASELIGALTKPSRTDVEDALDQVAHLPSEIGLPDDMVELLRKQQLEWFASGAPEAIFQERFDNLTQAEGAAILTFLVAFQEAHGADFPFNELETTIDRYWARYRDS